MLYTHSSVFTFLENVTLEYAQSSVKLSIFLHLIRLNCRNWSVFRWKIVFLIVWNRIEYIAMGERAMPAVLPVPFIFNISMAWVAVWIKEIQKICYVEKVHVIWTKRILRWNATWFFKLVKRIFSSERQGVDRSYHYYLIFRHSIMSNIFFSFEKCFFSINFGISEPSVYSDQLNTFHITTFL